MIPTPAEAALAAGREELTPEAEAEAVRLAKRSQALTNHSHGMMSEVDQVAARLRDRPEAR